MSYCSLWLVCTVTNSSIETRTPRSWNWWQWRSSEEPENSADGRRDFLFSICLFHIDIRLDPSKGKEGAIALAAWAAAGFPYVGLVVPIWTKLWPIEDFLLVNSTLMTRHHSQSIFVWQCDMICWFCFLHTDFVFKIRHLALLDLEQVCIKH